MLIAVSSPMFAQVNCYSRTRQQGIALMGEGHYSEAVRVFQSARSCPDKPADNDLQVKIDECRRVLRQQEERRRSQRTDVERSRAENERRRDAEFATKGYMEVTGLRFANASSEDEYLGEPGDPLYENDIRYIKPVLSYRGLAREPKTVELFIKFIGPDGTPVGGELTPDGYSYKHTVTVSPHGGRIGIPGWGNRQGGVFSPGINTCEIWCNGNKLTSGSFTVLENGKSNQVRSFVVTGLSLANTTFDNQILDGYGATLYSDNIRFLKARIKYNSDESRRIALSIRIRTPDGTELTDSDSYFIHQGYGQEMTLTGIGSKRLSLFEPGSHQYEILLDGKRLYSQSFHVIESDWRVTMDKVMDQPSEIYSSGEKYRGDFRSAGSGWVREGLGVFYWPDGTYYWGEWTDNNYDGEGIYLVGSTYQIPHCPGCSFYVGSFFENKKSGKGACYDMNGNLVYEGAFSNDAPTDPFPSTLSSDRRFEILGVDGGYYIGETRNGMRDGKGVFVQNTGEAWYGEWKNGSRLGEGLSLRRYSGRTDDGAGPRNL